MAESAQNLRKKSDMSLLISSAIQRKETLDFEDSPVHVTKIIYSAVGQSRYQTFPSLA